MCARRTILIFGARTHNGFVCFLVPRDQIETTCATGSRRAQKNQETSGKYWFYQVLLVKPRKTYRLYQVLLVKPNKTYRFYQVLLVKPKKTYRFYQVLLVKLNPTYRFYQVLLVKPNKTYRFYQVLLIKPSKTYTKNKIHGKLKPPRYPCQPYCVLVRVLSFLGFLTTLCSVRDHMVCHLFRQLPRTCFYRYLTLFQTMNLEKTQNNTFKNDKKTTQTLFSIAFI